MNYMEIYVITSNKHKFEEISSKLKQVGIKAVHKEIKYAELQADKTEQIAMASATTLATTINHPFIIDDSALEIDALNGFPGPYSSYVFQTIGYNGILRIMNNVSDRSAKFISVIIFYDGNKFIQFKGIVKGNIGFESRGNKGFGFDPIFYPEGYNLTFAEMELETKNQISHRGLATKKLIDYLRTNFVNTNNII